MCKLTGSTALAMPTLTDCSKKKSGTPASAVSAGPSRVPTSSHEAGAAVAGPVRAVSASASLGDAQRRSRVAAAGHTGLGAASPSAGAQEHRSNATANLCFAAMQSRCRFFY